MSDLPDLRSISGLVATCCTSGSIMPQYATAFADMRSYNDRSGYHKVEYQTFYAGLVEEGRDNAVRHMVSADGGAYQWLLQIDADAAPFPPDSLQRMLTCLYHAMPQLLVVGGYCQLKGWPYAPTIDTGSGTWEEHYPGEGVLSVIRTGAHFLMCKRDAFKYTGPPWFRTRHAMSPLRAMIDLDNYARITLGGDNPFVAAPEWDTLMHMAIKESPRETHVGEDSSFFDKLRATGGLAAVDTDLVVGHVASKTIMPQDFIEAMRDRRRQQAACLGLRR